MNESIIAKIQSIQFSDDVFTDGFVSETLLVNEDEKAESNLEFLRSELNGTWKGWPECVETRLP